MLLHLMAGEGDVIAAASCGAFRAITPERALLLGVLEMAFKDYLRTDHLREQADAEQWLFSDSEDAWSFVDDCTVLGLDYKLLRSRIAHMAAERRKLVRRSKHSRV